MANEFRVDYSQFDKAIRRVIDETGRAAGKVIHQQARLFVRDAIKYTPPTGKAPISESFNAQKKAGEQAIKNDIGAIFRAADELDVISNPSSKGARAAVNRFKRTGDAAGMQAFLRAIGINAKVEQALTLGLHSAHRSRATGRTLRGQAHHHLIMQKKTINSVTKILLARVGMAKAGWLVPARALGVDVPNWISRHSGQAGLFRFTENAKGITIEMGNSVRYAQKHDDKNRIIQRALNRRAESMGNQLNAAMGIVFRGYGKGKR